MVRKMDRLGRLVIPKEWRKHAGIGSDTYIEMQYDDDTQTITLRKTDMVLRCQCCGAVKRDEVIKFKDALICYDCLNQIKELRD